MILAFDCSISGFSVGVFNTDQTLIHAMSNSNPFSFTEHLVPTIQSLLQKNDIKFNQLTQIITTKGPGSFTGIRVGLATASGFSTALNIPVITVNTLLALATTSSTHATRHVVLDTKCGDMYCQSFTSFDGGTISEFDPPKILSPFEIINDFQEGVCITHPTTVNLLAQLKLPILSTELTPHHLLKASKINPISDLTPLYVRPVNATPSTP